MKWLLCRFFGHKMKVVVFTKDDEYNIIILDMKCDRCGREETEAWPLPQTVSKEKTDDH